MVLTIPDSAEASIQRLLSTGRYNTVPDVIEAGLRALETQSAPELPIEKFPPGSLLHLFTPEQNAEESVLVKGSSLTVEDE
jgi:hypothetical protein